MEGRCGHVVAKVWVTPVVTLIGERQMFEAIGLEL